MFGGLTKTSSRIAIVAAFGLMLGGFAFKATPAQAADLGGDCCADLEERVAELEATTVRKGNKKVSVTLSGWVVKSMNFWDDGHDDSFVVGDKDYDLGSRFAITGSATIAPGWSGGFNLTVIAPGSVFGISSNQNDELLGVDTRLFGLGTFGVINTLYSYIYIKSDTLGTLNWGHLSPASDNPAVLADISGTVIESNFVLFEGGGFFTKPKGAAAGVNGPVWNAFLLCNSAIAAGVDCFGTAEPAVRYDSPTWGGFRFETSYGTASVIPEILAADDARNNTSFTPRPATRDSHFWDIALFYTADWNSIKLSAAYAFTWEETNPLNGAEETIHQVGGSVMHKPSGLGVYAMAEWEQADKAKFNCINAGNSDNNKGCLVTGIPTFGDGLYHSQFDLPDTFAWGIKPFWRKAWIPLGTTVLYAEYAQYEDFFGFGNAIGAGTGLPTCNAIDAGGGTEGCTITDSEAERFGLGVVQEIDSAAMHVWLRWQHQELEATLTDSGTIAEGVPLVSGKQKFEDFDFFQAGAIIFF